jgi:hypothetical protein
MAPPTYRSHTIGNVTTSTLFLGARPPGVAEGDVLVAVLWEDGHAVGQMPLPDPGWTQLSGARRMATRRTYGTVFGKRAGPSEPGNYVWSYPQVTTARVLIVAVAGAGQTGAENMAAANPPAGASHPSAVVEVIDPESLLMTVLIAASVSDAPLSGIIEPAETTFRGGAGNDPTPIVVALADGVAPGIGPRQLTWATASPLEDVESVVYLVAIPPAPVAPGGPAIGGGRTALAVGLGLGL